ncbi:glycosyltransferase family 1 protein [Mucilaginibacter terrenus]|uniref:Glycosyltransferase family 1 protein n=1 Tax=Mucilaginibacter terrenus TaxID=2482727 RepID=A0A3E2NMM0_9SPHI|nr:glycosyltransferase family 4 protein [Mucilaginibacter terrenus]RFZ82228.1 glycosyltransferase family 1 protein [Mucilaginibacter terrenus]
MSKKVILLSLQTFSATGGIQKMTRTMAHSLQQICVEKGWKLRLLSLYDSDYDLQQQYIKAENFRGFQKNKFGFILSILSTVNNGDTLILSHVNFAIIGLLIKIFKPKADVWLIAHGIEVWRPFSAQRKLFLKYCDKIVSVSEYTQNEMIKRHNVDPLKCVVLNNAIDSFINIPKEISKPQNLLSRYRINKQTPVVFTLTRLASSEKYKGYDTLIATIGKLKAKFPDVRYVLSGKYDQKEGLRVKELIAEHGVMGSVILTGFIDERELADHFLLADLFVLPSKKEGFGIVFIEALACGLPVICGNADGSVDAVRNGELGIAINPDDPEELQLEISKYLSHPLNTNERKALQQKCLQYFSEDVYRKKLQTLLAG